VFVDLYQVVRQSMRISHASYSIKMVRTFFMEGAGQGAVTEGGDSILQFERWRTSGDPAILQAIVDYNEEDCLSTLKLRDWLLGRKQEAEARAAVTIPWKGVELPKESPKRVEEDVLTAARRVKLGLIGADSAILLGELLNYHRREAKPEWWAYFERRKKSLDDLLDDAQAIAYLEPVDGVAPETVLKSLVFPLQFPLQEFKLSADPKAQLEDPFRRTSAGTIAWIDATAGRLGLKRGAKRDEPLPSAIVSGKPLDTAAQRQALGRVADAVIAGGGAYAAVRALIGRDLPRVRSRASGASLQTLELSEQKALVAALDSSYLFIQGPPGSGKTFTGARLIVSLIAAGKRVGVAATSHKAINNLLREVEAVAQAEGVHFDGLKKGSGDDEFDGRLVKNTDSNEECQISEASLIAGTSWLFAREEMDQRLDYLFIDEAGQVSLADGVAMGTAARNVVLLGDPQQLPQVTQGVHPRKSGCSVLEHLLDGLATVPDDRGLFLARTWRMHPDVCAFISDLAYDGRLESAPSCERQRIESAAASRQLAGDTCSGSCRRAGAPASRRRDVHRLRWPHAAAHAGRHPGRCAVQHAGALSAGRAARGCRGRHSGQVPGAGSAGRVLLDGLVQRRGRAARPRVSLQPQPVQRGDFTRQGAGCPGVQPAIDGRAVPFGGADAPRERGLRLRRARNLVLDAHLRLAIIPPCRSSNIHAGRAAINLNS
jgi:uncharacterized protein